MEPESAGDEISGSKIIRDNGIFDFLTIEQAIGLYRTITYNGIPELDWKFYGRRKPNEAENESKSEEDSKVESEPIKNEQEDTDITQTAFDFDEEFNEMYLDKTPAADRTLQLKKRIETGSERKTNLSDIMSDIMKETSIVEDRPEPELEPVPMLVSGSESVPVPVLVSKPALELVFEQVQETVLEPSPSNVDRQDDPLPN